MFPVQFLKELVMYLDHWKKTVNDHDDCEPEDKKQMVLSSITEQGIRITGRVKLSEVVTAYFIYSFLILGTYTILVQY